MGKRGAEDVELVIAAQQGDGDAFGKLYERWFDRVHDVSRRVLRDPEIAAEVTQDVFLVTWRQLGTLRQPESFGGWLLRAARNRSLNRLQRDRRSVALGDEETVMEIDRRSPTAVAGGQPAEVFDRNEQEEIVWAAAVALGDRDASILHLHLRHGLDGVELADELDVSPNAANQAMFRLRSRLGGAIRAWMLWRHGHPVCERLDDVLASGGITEFGAAAVRTITAHADDCARCGRDRALLVAPEAMFAAVPILVAPLGLKARIAAALEAEGVPISSSRALDAKGSQVSSHSAPDGDPTSSTKSTRLLALAGVVVLVVAGCLVWVLAQPGDDQPLESVASTDSSTSTNDDAGFTTRFESTSDTAGVTTTVKPTTTSGTATVESTTTIDTATSVATTPATGPSNPAPDAPPAPPPAETPPAQQPDPRPAPEPAPVISAFAGGHRAVPGDCLSPSEYIELTWAAKNTDYVTISGPGAPPGRLSASGTAIACHPVAANYTLTAVGPDALATRTITVPPL